MFLVVGLGNPTKNYANNRHNVGFLAIDYILSNTQNKDISKTSFFGKLFKSQDILFLKPQTYMNDSGKSVSMVSSFFKIPSSQIYVIYDDLDMKFGSLKFRSGGRDAGHNGLKSINQYIANDYIKIKIGIGRPEHKSQVNSYVLGDFTSTQSDELHSDIFTNIHKSICNIEKKSFNEISSMYSL